MLPKDFCLLVVLLEYTVKSHQFPCRKQTDCNRMCSVCADGDAEGTSRCVFPFPYMFHEDKECSYTNKCKEDCNNHGFCQMVQDNYVPSCHCRAPFYGYSCRLRPAAANEAPFIQRLGWRFQGIIPAGKYLNLALQSTSKDKSGNPYLTIESSEGFYFKSTGNLLADSSHGEGHFIYWPQVRFPFERWRMNDNARMLKLGNTVLGYLSDLTVSMKSEMVLYYENNFTVFVSYENVPLKCIAVIELANCGSSVRAPTTFTRPNDIEIQTDVKYLADGRDTRTSFYKSECAGSTTWKVWKLSSEVMHSETENEPVKESYMTKPIHFQPYSLFFGIYKVMFEVKNVQINEETSVNFAYCYFKIKSLPLVAVVDGGSDRKISKHSGIVLSAQRSHDPNMPSIVQGHVRATWSCTTVLQPDATEDAFKPKELKVSERYFIPPDKLTFGAVYEFQLKVWTDLYVDCKECSDPIYPSFAHVRVQVANETEKAENDLLIQCLLNCEEKVAPNQVLMLKAGHKAVVSDTVKYNWLYSKGEGSVESTDSITEKDSPSHLFVVKENTLERGVKYTIVLQVISAGFFAKYSFETDDLNYNGSCSVNPTSGTKGLSFFDIECTGAQESSLRFEFYDKSSEEVAKEIMFNGRMLGSSHTGKLLGASLTRGNVVVYVIDCFGLSVSKKLEVTLTDADITEDVLKEITTNLTTAIQQGEVTTMLGLASFIPDVLPPTVDKSVMLNLLLHAIVQVPLLTLADVKSCTSTLANVLIALNKPTQLELKPALLKFTLGVIQSQAGIFKNNMLNRERSRWMSPGEVRLLATTILNCLSAVLMSKVNGTEGMSEDNFPLHILYDLQQGSSYVVNTIDTVSDILSYIQTSGQPLTKISSANSDFIVWVVENDKRYPMNNYLQKDKEIPVTVSVSMIKHIERDIRAEEDLGLQVVFVNINPFWWCVSDVKSNLVSVSLTRQVKNQKLAKLKNNIGTPLGLYVQLDNSTSSVIITGSTSLIDSNMSLLMKDEKVKIHRIDLRPRSLTFVTFLFPPTNSTLRVLAMEKFRPDYELMEEKSVVISQQSPGYPLENHNRDEPDFLYIGILPGKDVPANLSVLYSFELNTTICQVWSNGQWISSGCRVGSNTSGKKVHCECTHFSIFGAAFLVPPQEVDPFADVKLFLTVDENPLVVICVSIILAIYGLLCIWAVWRDKRDTHFKNVIVLDDNYPTDRFPYLLAVFTGSRVNAGTTAHVGIRLFGELESSRVHVLASSDRKVLRHDTDDWFLIYCPERLGDLESIHVWHDNHGWSPEWFCEKIHVYDLTDAIETVFVVKEWVALRLNYFPEANIVPATEQDVFSVKTLFVDNFLLGLRDRHVLLSIFLRHPRNEVSRFQRINVLVGVLLVAMLCSVMFYLPPDEQRGVDDAYYVVGTREMIVSIQSLVISGVFASVLMLSFRRSYTLQCQTHHSIVNWRNNEYYQFGVQGGFGFTTVAPQNDDYDTKGTRVGHSQINTHYGSDKNADGTVVDVLKHNKKESLCQHYVRIVVKTLKTNSLPPAQLSTSALGVEVNRGMLTFAWCFCITTILVCSYLIMLYGLRLGSVKSKKWVTSVIFTFGGDIFIASPIRLICVSIVLTMAFQKMYEVSTHAVDVKKGKEILRSRDNESYITKLIDSRCQRMYAPMRSSVRDGFIARKEWLANWWTLVHFIFSACFIVVVSTMISRLWSSNFDFNNQVKKLVTLSHHPEIGSIDFDQISSITDFESYLGVTLMNILYCLRWYNDMGLIRDRTAHNRYWVADFTNRMVGLPMVRQIRVKPTECVNIVLKRGTCITHYSRDREDTDVYGVGWTPADWDAVARENSPWKYTEVPTSVMIGLYLLYGTPGGSYGNGGYQVTLGPSRKQADLMLAELKNHHWQNSLTKAVFVEFTLFNRNRNLFSQVTLNVRYLAAGNLKLGLQVISVEGRVQLSAWIVVFALYMCCYLFRSLYVINEQGFLEYLSASINKLRLVVIFLGLLSIVLYVLHHHTLDQYFVSFHKKTTDSYFQFDEFTFYFILLKLSLSFLLGFTILLAVMLMRAGRTLLTYYYTFVMSIRWICWLTLTTLMLLFVIHRVSYYINVLKAYDYSELTGRHKTTSHFTLRELEHTQVKVLVFVKTVIISTSMALFVVLFLYYKKDASSYRLQYSDNFNFLSFLRCELIRRRIQGVE